VYWYEFMWQERLVRESTKQGNDKIARQMEAAHRTSLAKGLADIRDRKPVPKLSEFARQRFLPIVEATFVSNPRTLEWYRNGAARLSSCAELAKTPLDPRSAGSKLQAAWRTGGALACRCQVSIESCRSCAVCFALQSSGG